MPGKRNQRDESRESRDGSGLGSDRSAFFARVFAVVSNIPYGRVTTYGAIARALGTPRAARSVGWALRVAPDGAGLPCHRVVDRQGFLSGGWHWGHPDVMAGLLRDEGVPFLNPHQVDLAACRWLPEENDLEHRAGIDHPPAREERAATARSSPG